MREIRYGCHRKNREEDSQPEETRSSKHKEHGGGNLDEHQ